MRISVDDVFNGYVLMLKSVAHDYRDISKNNLYPSDDVL
uniref:Transcriptional regulator n=1 Tax=Heterorhabditis bacteriophora TaxID=37862 RepID=A0A1I7X011_HETBA